MRVLHTADWHLGQKFYHQNREEEHRLMLNWLVQLLDNQRVECLVVAGDIFDVRNPPNTAEQIYFQFLAAVLKTNCRHVVLIGGNHDLPSKLNAPRRLLAALHIHVVGCATENLENELIFLKNEAGATELLVAAVPFLSTRDLEAAASGESAAERILRIQTGIAEHYKNVAALCEAEKKRGTPILATGHLYARGATVADSKKQSNIYLGNLENIAAEQFPAVFDYVALGHIHRAQVVGGAAHIRYAGSPIPLSFSELADKKTVSILDFETGKGLVCCTEIEVPTFRRLQKLSGNLDTVFQKIEAVAAQIQPDELDAWLEIVVETERDIPLLEVQLRDFVKNFRLEILFSKQERVGKKAEIRANEPQVSLAELSPLDVFLKKCASKNLDILETEELKTTFLELQEWAERQGEASIF